MQTRHNLILRYHPRMAVKQQDEIDAINQIVESVDAYIQGQEKLSDVEKFAAVLDPALSRAKEHPDRKDWYSDLLGRLIRERRKIPKDERLKLYRNDSVDEVDTTDLEYWRLKPELEWDFSAIDVDYDHHLADPESSQVKAQLVDKRDYDAESERLAVRHRISFAKMFLGKDGGYSLRKFKRIFKREMEENPDKYEILRPGMQTSALPKHYEESEFADPEMWKDEISEEEEEELTLDKYLE